MRGLAEYAANRESAGTLAYAAERTMVIEGHQVAWVRYEVVDDSMQNHGSVGHQVMCDCDLADKRVINRVQGEDPHACRYRKAAQLLRALEARAEYEVPGSPGFVPYDGHPDIRRPLAGNMILAFEPERAEAIILDLVRRASAGEWVGQLDSMLYSQQVATILDSPPAAVRNLGLRMAKERKLSMSGAIMVPYDNRYEPRDDDDSLLDDARPPEGEPLVGHLTFYSETGTEGGHWAFTEDGKEGYDGLHVLRTGDYLSIGADGGLWSGHIRLRHYALFTEDANGAWIHADQRGVDRDEWANHFFKRRPARLWLSPRPGPGG